MKFDHSMIEINELTADIKILPIESLLTIIWIKSSMISNIPESKKQLPIICHVNCLARSLLFIIAFFGLYVAMMTLYSANDSLAKAINPGIINANRPAMMITVLIIFTIMRSAQRSKLTDRHSLILHCSSSTVL